MTDKQPPRPDYFDPAEYPPPSGKLILLTNEETSIIGKWGPGCKAWFPLPKIPKHLKRGGQ